MNMIKALKAALRKTQIDVFLLHLTSNFSRVSIFNDLSITNLRRLCTTPSGKHLVYKLYDQRVKNYSFYRAKMYFYSGGDPKIISRDLMTCLAISPRTPKFIELQLATLEARGRLTHQEYADQILFCMKEKIYTDEILRRAAIHYESKQEYQKADEAVAIFLKLYEPSLLKGSILLYRPLKANGYNFSDKEKSERSLLYETLINNKYFKVFQQEFSEKSVSIVGNSPVETGRKRGNLIDCSEMIIRFNNFIINDRFKEDYGNKVHVWVNSGVSDVEFKDPKNFEFILYTNDITTRSLTNDMIQNLYLQCVHSKPSVLKEELFSDIKERHGVLILSAGVKLAWLAKLNRKNLNSSLFGFSLIDQLQSQKQRHYFQTPNRSRLHGSSHNWSTERKILNELLEEKSHEK